EPAPAAAAAGPGVIRRPPVAPELPRGPGGVRVRLPTQPVRPGGQHAGGRGTPMTRADWIAVVVGFVVALPVGTLGEYLLHRFVLHARSRTYITHRHRLHHKDNRADTLWGDFRDFLPGMVPVGWLGFLHGIAAGFGFFLGC